MEIWREQYESKWESSPNFGVKMKKIKPPPEDTHRETNSSHLKIGHPKRKRFHSGYPFACAKICLFQGGYILQSSKRLFLFQIPLPSSQSMLKVHCRCTPSWKGKMSFIGKFHYPSVFQKNIKGTISIRWLSPFLNICTFLFGEKLATHWIVPFDHITLLDCIYSRCWCERLISPFSSSPPVKFRTKRLSGNKHLYLRNFKQWQITGDWKKRVRC